MKPVILLTLFCLSICVFAEEGRVVQIDRAVADSPEKIPPKLYYLDIGAKAGLGVGDTVEVLRDRTVVSGITGEVGDILPTLVGELRVKFLGERTSIAEFAEQRNPDSVPQLDYPTVMIGDKVRVKSVQ